MKYQTAQRVKAIAALSLILLVFYLVLNLSGLLHFIYSDPPATHISSSNDETIQLTSKGKGFYKLEGVEYIVTGPDGDVIYRREVDLTEIDSLLLEIEPYNQAMKSGKVVDKVSLKSSWLGVFKKSKVLYVRECDVEFLDDQNSGGECRWEMR